MKSKYLILLKIQIYGLFGLNRARFSKDPKEKRRSRGAVAAGCLITLLLLFYSGLYSVAMASLGLAETLPVTAVLISSIIILFLTFLKSSGILIGLKDYDMVMSLPVKNSDVVLSRLSVVYLLNLGICLLVSLPAAITYAFCLPGGRAGAIIFLLCTLFIPVIPMIISLALGVLISAVTTHSRKKHFFSLFLSMAVIVLIVVGSMQLQNVSADQFKDFGTLLSNTASRYYPPANLMSLAVTRVSPGYFFLYALLSILIAALFVIIVSHFYKRMNTSFLSARTGRAKTGHLRKSSPAAAMYKREISRYFSCTVYALNSSIGMVLLLVLAIALMFISPDSLEKQIGIPGFQIMLKHSLPLLAAVLVSLSSTTSASLSIEGQNRWLMYILPVRSIDIFRVKIALNLTVILPLLIVSIILFGIRMKVTAARAIFLIIVPVIYALYISILGMYLNTVFPKYNWKNEQEAVKNSASVLITIAIGGISSIIPLLLCFALPDSSYIIMSISSAAVLVIAALLYKKLQSVNLADK